MWQRNNVETAQKKKALIRSNIFTVQHIDIYGSIKKGYKKIENQVQDGLKFFLKKRNVLKMITVYSPLKKDEKVGEKKK